MDCWLGGLAPGSAVIRCRGIALGTAWLLYVASAAISATAGLEEALASGDACLWSWTTSGSPAKQLLSADVIVSARKP